MNELISIIVPIFKVEKYMSRCIDSILSQSYKNLEIILIDDGSPDRCGEICDQYKRIDNRIKVIHKKNGGLSEARNSGIEVSQGRYISFIDSDDWISDIYIEKLYHLLKKSNSDISICNYIRTFTNDIQTPISKEELYEYSNIDALEQLTGKFDVQMVTAWGKLYKRELFEDIRFPNKKIHEDEFTTYKVLYKAKKVVFSTKELYFYWQRSDSIMGIGFTLKARFDYFEALDERLVFFRQAGLTSLYQNTVKIYLFRIMDTYWLAVKCNKKKSELLSIVNIAKKLKNIILENNFSYFFKKKYFMFLKLPFIVVFLQKIYSKTYCVFKNKR